MSTESIDYRSPNDKINDAIKVLEAQLAVLRENKREDHEKYPVFNPHSQLARDIYNLEKQIRDLHNQFTLEEESDPVQKEKLSKLFELKERLAHIESWVGAPDKEDLGEMESLRKKIELLEAETL